MDKLKSTKMIGQKILHNQAGACYYIISQNVLHYQATSVLHYRVMLLHYQAIITLTGDNYMLSSNTPVNSSKGQQELIDVCHTNKHNTHSLRYCSFNVFVEIISR